MSPLLIKIKRPALKAIFGLDPAKCKGADAPLHFKPDRPMLSKSRSDLFSKECHFISTQTAIRRNHHANLRLSFDMLRDTRGDFDAMSARNTVVMAEVHLIRALCEMKKPFREKLLLIQRSYGRPQGGEC